MSLSREPASEAGNAALPGIPAFTAAAGTTRNWAGNVEFRPARIDRPLTIAQLSAAVRESDRVRVVGSKHSFNGIAATDRTWIDLRSLGTAMTFHSRTSVEVPAWMTVREVNERLAERGLALASIGEIDEQQIGGVIATGTHGTGLEWGTMSDLVTGVKIVNGRGKLVELTGGQELAAARTHLGALGAVVSVTLETVPAHNLERTRMIMPIDEAIDPAFMRGHDHTQLFYFPFTEGMYVRALDRTDRRNSSFLGWNLGRRIEWVMENRGVRLLFAFSRANSDLSRIPQLMRSVQKRVGKGTDVGASYFQMTSVRTLKYHELEMALDLADMPAAFEEVRKIIKSLSQLEPNSSERFYAHLPVTMRAVKGVGDNLLSPTLGRDTAYLSVTSCTGFKGYERYFRAVEKALRSRFGARPHWGKHHWIYPAPLYPGAEAFRGVCRSLDPEGKFRNKFVESRLFT